MKTVLRLFIFLTFLTFGNESVKAQKTTQRHGFAIIEKGTITNQSLLEIALMNSDMSNYRLKAERVRITFDNGAVVELFSAAEMRNLGYNINPEDFQETFPDKYELPVFQLSENGTLLAKYTKKAVK